MPKGKQQSAAQRREKQRQQRRQRLEGAQNTLQPVKRQSGPKMRRRGWNQRYMVPIVLLLLAAIIGVFVYLSHQPQAGAPAPTLTSSQVLKAVTQVNSGILSVVGTGGVQSPVKAVSGSGSGSPPVLTGPTGKPEFLYIGAEYCPFCAAERWSMVVALSRFGSFSQLYQTTSSASDVFPSTPTFSFYSKLYNGPMYASQYIDFVAVEELGNVADSSGNYPTLQTPTTQQQQLITTYDASGSIPFVDIGNKFTGEGLGQGFSPQDLANMQVSDIANNLSNASSSVTQHILGTANYLTAAICIVTQQQPGSVCSTSAIQKIEQTLNKTSLNASGTQIAVAVSFEAALRREM